MFPAVALRCPLDKSVRTPEGVIVLYASSVTPSADVAGEPRGSGLRVATVSLENWQPLV